MTQKSRAKRGWWAYPVYGILGLLALACGGYLARGQMPPMSPATGPTYTTGGTTTAPAGTAPSSTSRPPLPTVQFQTGQYTANEHGKEARLTVMLSFAVDHPVEVGYALHDGTAKAGQDYQATGKTLVFPAGATSQSIGVGIRDNGDYSQRSRYFTVSLSVSKAARARLGKPPTAVVMIREDDPVLVAEIQIPGVGASGKVNPGMFVAVNANNDNGSDLLYPNGEKVPAGKYGIPKVRDFDKKNVDLKQDDPDLQEVKLLARNLKPGGPETIALKVETKKDARAQVEIWGSKRKPTPQIRLTGWTKNTLPPSVFVEGVREGADLREITLSLEISKDGKVVAWDKCSVTVTPVLTNLEAKVKTTADGKKATPDIADVAGQAWIIRSEGDLPPPAVMTSAEARWDRVSGDLRFIQTVKIVNNLELEITTKEGEKKKEKGWGADRGPMKWAFKKETGKTVVDSLYPVQVPFYTGREDRKEEPNLMLRGAGSTSNSVADYPRIPLEAGKRSSREKEWGHSVLPPRDGTTKIDVTEKFIISATVAFKDRSIYCLGHQPWETRFAGTVKPAAGGGYTFEKAAENANKGSGKFTPEVRDNANPEALGPVIANENASWQGRDGK